MNKTTKSKIAVRQAGFILTMELMIILAVLGIGLLVGFFAVREAVFKYYVTQQSREVFVTDANGENLGQAIGFDEHEAPLLVYVDRSQDENYRALIGVRDDRFTSREPVYYTLPNCQGDPCMKRSSRETLDNQGVDYLPGTGAVSFLYALQGGPTYGIGAGTDDRIKGNLYRAGTQSCEVDVVSAALGSRWISQKVVDSEPCEPFVLPVFVDTPGLICPTGEDVNNEIFNPLCETLVVAESVPGIGNPDRNVLDDFLAPFSVNLPVDTGPDSWSYIPPDSESGAELGN